MAKLHDVTLALGGFTQPDLSGLSLHLEKRLNLLSENDSLSLQVSGGWSSTDLSKDQVLSALPQETRMAEGELVSRIKDGQERRTAVDGYLALNLNLVNYSFFQMRGVLGGGLQYRHASIRANLMDDPLRNGVPNDGYGGDIASDPESSPSYTTRTDLLVAGMAGINLVLDPFDWGGRLIAQGNVQLNTHGEADIRGVLLFAWAFGEGSQPPPVFKPSPVIADKTEKPAEPPKDENKEELAKKPEPKPEPAKPEEAKEPEPVKKPVKVKPPEKTEEKKEEKKKEEPKTTIPATSKDGEPLPLSLGDPPATPGKVEKKEPPKTPVKPPVVVKPAPSQVTTEDGEALPIF